MQNPYKLTVLSKEFWEDLPKLSQEKLSFLQWLKSHQFFLIFKLPMIDSEVLLDKKMLKFNFLEIKSPKFKLPERFHQLKVKDKWSEFFKSKIWSSRIKLMIWGFPKDLKNLFENIKVKLENMKIESWSLKMKSQNLSQDFWISKDNMKLKVNYPNNMLRSPLNLNQNSKDSLLLLFLTIWI